MKKYKFHLKGTKQKNTKDITGVVFAANKGQAFNMVYSMFEKGENPQKEIASYKGGTWKIADFIQNASSYKGLEGKYKVYSTSISVA